MRKALTLCLTIIIMLTLTACSNLQKDDENNSSQDTNKNYLSKPSEIPDEKFREYLCIKYNLSGTSENNWQLNNTTDFEVIKNITQISLYQNYEHSLSGIELFEKLNVLKVYDSNIEEIDVSKNLALNDLRLFNTEITKLDIHNNKYLMYLNIRNENISELDITNNTRLAYINIEGTKIRKLNCMNFSGKLNGIECDKNVNLVGVRQDMK